MKISVSPKDCRFTIVDLHLGSPFVLSMLPRITATGESPVVKSNYELKVHHLHLVAIWTTTCFTKVHASQKPLSFHATFSLPTARVHGLSSLDLHSWLGPQPGFLCFRFASTAWPMFFPPSVEQITFQKNGFNNSLAQQSGIA